MKSAVVMELSNNKAVVLLSDGRFETVNAMAGWEVGAVVNVRIRQSASVSFYKKIAAVAAAFAVLAVSAFVLGYIIKTPTSLISMDINPSVEMEINRLGRVVSTTAYNDDGEELLADMKLKGMKYQDAIWNILQSDDMKPYLESRNYIDFAVYSESRQQELLDNLQSATSELLSPYPNLAVSCNAVSRDVVGNARNHHISPGKMRAIMELVEINPDTQTEDYIGCDINQINRDIETCRRAGGESGEAYGNGHGHSNDYGHGQGQHSQNQSQNSGTGESSGQGQGSEGQGSGSGETQNKSGGAGSEAQGSGGGSGQDNSQSEENSDSSNLERQQERKGWNS